MTLYRVPRIASPAISIAISRHEHNECGRGWKDVTEEILENIWQSTDSTHYTVAFTIWLVAFWCVVRTFQSVPMRKVPFRFPNLKFSANKPYITFHSSPVSFADIFWATNCTTSGLKSFLAAKGYTLITEILMAYNGPWFLLPDLLSCHS
jgi:hypothetical protein